MSVSGADVRYSAQPSPETFEDSALSHESARPSRPEMSQSLPSTGIFGQPMRTGKEMSTNVPAFAASTDWVNWSTPKIPMEQSTVPGPSSTTPHYDWDLIVSTFARHATKMATENDMPPPTIPLTRAALQNSVTQAAGPSSTPVVSPTSERESESNSVFETAKGLAMISLEATAEPHYVGESSGYLWMTVISKGMHAPRLNSVTHKRRIRNSRSPSPSRPATLRTKLLRPLSEDLSKLIIDTVYQHLHSRVRTLVSHRSKVI